VIDRFAPDAVIEVILHACHSYNIEAYKIMTHVKEKHNLPYLKIETDYSEGDIEQIRTRVEALFEGIPCRPHQNLLNKLEKRTIPAPG
jgi:benzoyl-CoA reductase/2-hydroxyglutaryl-CoA dehydratase subunit BcrC/BadD/HgdB